MPNVKKPSPSEWSALYPKIPLEPFAFESLKMRLLILPFVELVFCISIIAPPLFVDVLLLLALNLAIC